MVTQAIKQWLQNLFAWWPWKRSTETDYAHLHDMTNMGAAQESILRTTVDGSITQPGATSVAVEHAEGAAPPEMSWSTTEEHAPSSPPEETHISLSPSQEPVRKRSSPEDMLEKPVAPSMEQQLDFLRYLVQRGVVNEGFERGKEPEQYRKPV